MRRIGPIACLLLLASSASAQEFSNGPIGPFLVVLRADSGHSTSGGTDVYTVSGLPKQAGYVYRVWARSYVSGTSTIRWVGSASSGAVSGPITQTPATAIGGITSGQAGQTDMWAFCGKIAMPADSATLQVAVNADGALFECLGRGYGNSPTSTRLGFYNTGSNVDNTECGLRRSSISSPASATLMFPVIPGTTYRILGRILEWEGCRNVCASEIIGFGTRAPGSGDSNHDDFQNSGLTVLDPSLHEEPADSCGGFVGYGTMSYWLSSSSQNQPAAVATEANQLTAGNMGYVNVIWQTQGDCLGGALGLFTFTDFYVLPVGFTLRETTGGTARDDVWQDAPAISSGERLLLDALAKLNSTASESTTYGKGVYSATTADKNAAAAKATAALSSGSQLDSVRVRLAQLFNWPTLPDEAGDYVVHINFTVPVIGTINQDWHTLPLNNLGASPLGSGVWHAVDVLRLLVLWGLKAFCVWRFALAVWSEFSWSSQP